MSGIQKELRSVYRTQAEVDMVEKLGYALMKAMNNVEQHSRDGEERAFQPSNAKSVSPLTVNVTRHTWTAGSTEDGVDIFSAVYPSAIGKTEFLAQSGIVYPPDGDDHPRRKGSRLLAALLSRQ